MLAFGFVYSDNPDVFSDEDPNQAVVVTEKGEMLKGNANHATVIEPVTETPASQDRLRRLLEKLEAQRLRQSEDLPGDIPLSTAVVSVTDPTGDDDFLNSDGAADRAVALQDFLVAMNTGQGRETTSGRFLDLLDLDADLGDLSTQALSFPDSASNPPAEPTPEDYQPRRIGDTRDVDVIRKARTHNMTVLLTGAPGTGKTVLCEAAHGPELITVSCHEGMVLSDLVGQWMPVPTSPGEFIWQDGPLLIAMQEGRPLLLDDASWLSLEVQATLLPVLDTRRSITVIDRPAVNHFVASEGFCVVLTQNPDVGVGIIDPIRSRISFEVHVPSDLSTAQRLGVDPDLLAVAYRLEEDDQERRQQGSIGWVPPIRTLLEATRIRDAFGMEFAASTFVASCPITQADFRQQVQQMVKDQVGMDRVNDGLMSLG